MFICIYFNWQLNLAECNVSRASEFRVDLTWPLLWIQVLQIPADTDLPHQTRASIARECFGCVQELGLSGTNSSKISELSEFQQNLRQNPYFWNQHDWATFSSISKFLEMKRNWIVSIVEHWSYGLFALIAQ